MADWASAIAQGIGAAANTGANIIGDQMKQDQQIAAEQRAADIKLDLNQRMAAADEMMKNRALERYSGLVKDQMGVEVPQEADGVDKTGITRDAGKAVGLIDVGGTKVRGDFNADPATLKTMLADANARLTNPNSTDQVRTEAQELIAVLQKQIDAQKSLNEDAVDGKTRKRTLEEAVTAANEYALQNDPTAYVAGTTAYNNANKDDIAEKRLAQQAKLAAAAGDRQLQLERMREDGRYRDILAKLDANGGTAGHLPANVATIEYLVQHGSSFEDARDAVLGNGDGARKDPVALASSMAAQLIANGAVRVTKDDPPGTTVAGKATQMALQGLQTIQTTLGGPARPGKPGAGAGATPAGLPGLPGMPDPTNPLGLNLPGMK